MRGFSKTIVGAATAANGRERCSGPKALWNVSALYDTHVLSHLRALLLELDVPVPLREQRVIAATADVGARVESRATLANNNVAGKHFLATENLYAKTFTLGIATVLTATACFLMCHCCLPVSSIARAAPGLR
jgi:hypothetical protein